MCAPETGSAEAVMAAEDALMAAYGCQDCNSEIGYTIEVRHSPTCVHTRTPEVGPDPDIGAAFTRAFFVSDFAECRRLIEARSP